MNKLDRYKIVVRYAKSAGIIKNQKDLGLKLGYTNESAFSQVLNGVVNEPKDFISRISSIIPDLNIDWLVSGEGEMLKNFDGGAEMDCMSVKDRIKAFISSVGMTNQRFEAECGLSNGYISNMRKGVGEDALERISNRFPELSRAWLLSGEGEMLKNSAAGAEIDGPDEFSVPLLPIAAQGGTLNDFVTSVKVAECERIVSPIRNVDFAMTVSGDSMAPDYPNGAQILIKKVDERAFIEWGRVYVLDTCNGSVIKELRKSEDSESVMCYSLNPDPKYQPFAVRFADIYGMYRVLMCMSLR